MVDSTGTLYVSSYYNNSVLVLGSNGELLNVLTSAGMDGPMGLTLDRDEATLYVTSHRSNIITIFDLPSRVSKDVILEKTPLVHGPSAIEVLDDGSALVSMYETGALLLLNTSHGWAQTLIREATEKLSLPVM